MGLDQLSVELCVRLINEEDSTVPLSVNAAIGQIVEFIEAIEPRMKSGGRLIYIGAGTSGRLGVLDSAECPPTFQSPPEQVVGIIAGGEAALRRAVEGKEDEPDGAGPELELLKLTERDTVLGIAAVGTTPYVLGALRLAHERGALTGLLTSVPINQPESVKHLIFVSTGPEVLTGSTRMKAGTATKLVLNTISTTLMVRLGKVYENLMVDLRTTNDKLRDRAARIVSMLTDLDRASCFTLLARASGSVKHAVVMQRRGCSLEEAERRLKAAEGRLREALGEGD